MAPNIAKNIIAFMERATISGKEVPAYVEALAALNPLTIPKDPANEDDGGETETA